MFRRENELGGVLHDDVLGTYRYLIQDPSITINHNKTIIKKLGCVRYVRARTFMPT